MPCVKDGPMYEIALYNFIADILFKKAPQVCVCVRETGDVNGGSQCEMLLIHVCACLRACVCLTEHSLLLC